jgi:hypothetical protein
VYFHNNRPLIDAKFDKEMLKNRILNMVALPDMCLNVKLGVMATLKNSLKKLGGQDNKSHLHCIFCTETKSLKEYDERTFILDYDPQRRHYRAR